MNTQRKTTPLDPIRESKEFQLQHSATLEHANTLRRLLELESTEKACAPAGIVEDQPGVVVVTEHAAEEEESREDQ